MKSATWTAEEFFKHASLGIDDASLFESSLQTEDEVKQQGISERPTTPPDVSIKRPPCSHTELTSCFRERLCLRNDLSCVSESDQRQIAEVLMMAIVAVWPEHRKQSSDPLLGYEENKELERQIAVYVVETLEALFYKSIQNLQDMNLRAVFSAEANLSRQKTRTAAEAHGSLNILNIRRKLAGKMRQKAAQERQPVDLPTKAEGVSSNLSSQKKIGAALSENLSSRILKKELSELSRAMPVLPIMQKPIVWNENHQRLPSRGISKGQEPEFEEKGNCLAEKNFTQCDESAENTFHLKKSASMPALEMDLESLEEFEGAKEAGKGGPGSILANMALTSEKQNESFAALTPSEDLRLLASNKECVGKAFNNENLLQEDLHPILQAEPFVPSHRVELEAKISKLEKERQDVDDGCSESLDAESVASTIDTIHADYTDHNTLESSNLHAQPAVVSLKVPGGGVVRLADVRVSRRVCESSITLQKHPAIYNEFLGEIDDSTARSLDNKLVAGEEIRELYDEIASTISKDYLKFDQDAYVHVAAPERTEQGDLFMSALLKNKAWPSNILNRDLRKSLSPPWGGSASLEDWMNEPRFNGMGREDMLKFNKGALKKAPDAPNHRASTFITDKKIALSGNTQLTNAAWMMWYKAVLDTDDYLKCLMDVDNDYLSQIFHLYDSDEELEDALSVQAKAAELLRRKQLQERVDLVRAKKTFYQEGFWNTQCVSLGGLGHDPEGDATNLDEGNQSSEMHKGIKSSPYSGLQFRLEQLWANLKMPESARQAMVLKYNSSKSYEQMNEMLELWEAAAQLVVQREILIGKLEAFEREASDPNRFFEKGPSGSSVARISEATIREKLNKAIMALQNDLSPLLSEVKRKCGDVVTFEGRPYLQKMHSDRVEMLYWLQQERREKALELSSGIPSGAALGGKCELKLGVAQWP